MLLMDELSKISSSLSVARIVPLIVERIVGETWCERAEIPQMALNRRGVGDSDERKSAWAHKVSTHPQDSDFTLADFGYDRKVTGMRREEIIEKPEGLRLARVYRECLREYELFGVSSFDSLNSNKRAARLPWLAISGRYHSNEAIPRVINCERLGIPAQKAEVRKGKKKRGKDGTSLKSTGPILSTGKVEVECMR